MSLNDGYIDTPVYVINKLRHDSLLYKFSVWYVHFYPAVFVKGYKCHIFFANSLPDTRFHGIFLCGQCKDGRHITHKYFRYSIFMQDFYQMLNYEWICIGRAWIAIDNIGFYKDSFSFNIKPFESTDEVDTFLEHRIHIVTMNNGDEGLVHI